MVLDGDKWLVPGVLVAALETLERDAPDNVGQRLMLGVGWIFCLLDIWLKSRDPQNSPSSTPFHTRELVGQERNSGATPAFQRR